MWYLAMTGLVLFVAVVVAIILTFAWQIEHSESDRAITQRVPKKSLEEQLRSESHSKVEEFYSMSSGARHLLSIRDPFSPTGYFKGIHRDHAEDFSCSYYSPLEVWAEDDYAHSEGNLVRIREKESPLGTERLLDLANAECFDLSEITDDEWDLIIQRYLLHVEKLHKTKVKVDSVLPKVSEQTKMGLDHLIKSEEAEREVSSDAAYENDPKSSWEHRFSELDDIADEQSQTHSSWRQLLSQEKSPSA